MERGVVKRGEKRDHWSLKCLVLMDMISSRSDVKEFSSVSDVDGCGGGDYVHMCRRVRGVERECMEGGEVVSREMI